MRTMAIDIGSARIGVALSDETGLIAQPFETLKAGPSLDEDARAIADLCEEHGVEEIVIGLPLSLSGGDRGATARRARALGARLREACDLPIRYLDERFSTAQAERALIDGGVRRADRKKVVDKVAAALILQAYLDHRGRNE